MNKFEIGKTYTTRSMCDYECIFRYTIEDRTDKTVTIKGKRFKIHIFDNEEVVYPEGKHSMCPIIKPSKIELK